MSVTYFEVFEARFGFKSLTKTVLDETLFAFLLALSKKAKEDDATHSLLDALVFEDINPKGYLFMEAITDYGDTRRATNILKALKAKGFWADSGEEGSFGFALEGKEKECKNEIQRIEMKIAAQDGYLGW
jgi:hypothetical protein